MNNDNGGRAVERLLLNCDMGESFGSWRMGLDAEVMPYIDCANIACGYHAGDPSIMRRTVALALEHGVTIGAHPAYPDLVGFGRRSMACSPEEIRDLLHYQIGALDGICKVLGGRVAYVKPHGALYNDMMADPLKLRTVLEAVAAYGGGLPLMLMATADNRAAQALGDEIGVPLWFEAFADRAYTASGHLVSRRLPGAVHHDPALVVEQAVRLARGDTLVADDGSALTLAASTLCVHGDNDSSVAAVRQIRQALDALEPR
ncbi:MULTISPECIES: 5-oxoprolinase subunit PxpA [unclassified Pseudomonas]|uniref:5-oxoprolinase subunit PxpA n=1 Tax=unclassified Pseudomonas TaxID=196821 RepID=UPI000A1E65DE|nr:MULTISPECIES: 5-oxoprolinase subunit PxpA [unclassified Pseudomonas]